MGSVVFVIHRPATHVLAAGVRTLVASAQAWGGVTGLLSDQTDLQAALNSMNAGINDKVDKSGDKVLSDENYTAADKAKLGGIATSATQNSSDSHLLDRENHSGEQSISTVAGLQAALDDKATSAEVGNIASALALIVG